MKLTNKDKNYLISIGYDSDDFTQIEETKFIYKLLGEKYSFKLNQKEVLEILDREIFISGIGRATLHGSAVCYKTNSQGNKVTIYFEKKNLKKVEKRLDRY